MKIDNKILFVDSLAEITSHHDREVIEKSLLKTLSEHEGSQEFWLYKVINLEPNIALCLLAQLSNDQVVTINKPRKHDIPKKIIDQIVNTIETKSITVTRSSEQGICKVIYPVFKNVSEIFAILIQNTTEIDLHKQQLIAGLLRIYSNYLILIENTKRDKLTGLLNRETLNEEIIRILTVNNKTNRQHKIKHSPYEDDNRKNEAQFSNWLGVLDIDHFKVINDTYGHLYGDEVLILVARLIEKSIRDYDLAFRFGGEEFVIILEANDIDDAEKAFDRMRNLIVQHSFAKIEKLTVSIGVTQIADQEDPSVVIGYADKALYYAKENGRNSVYIYEKLIEQKLLIADLQIDCDDVELF